MERRKERFKGDPRCAIAGGWIRFESKFVEVDDAMPGNDNRNADAEILECDSRAPNIAESATFANGTASTATITNVTHHP